jgi:hypothetical protein
MEWKLIHPFSLNIFITFLLRLFIIYYLAMITRTYPRQWRIELLRNLWFLLPRLK